MKYKIKLLGARTGQGHISALRAVEDEFSFMGIHTMAYPSFYEDAAICNEVLSDFNNMLAMKSSALSIQLNELFVLEGTKVDEKRYLAYSDYFNQVLSDEKQIVISFTPLINKYVIKYLSENRPKTKFYIVVTDPYNPMYPGFEAKGACAYFCPSSISEMQLLKRGISEEKIQVTGFPLRKIHLEESVVDPKEFSIKTKRKIVLIACGAYGNPAFIPLIKEILALQNKDYYYLVVCGNNKMIEKLLTKHITENKYENVTILGFVNYMQNLLDISSICITKAGANAIHECIAHGVIPFIVGFWGLQYQERGVFEYLKQCYNLDLQFKQSSDLVDFFKLPYCETKIEEERKKLTKEGLYGASNIVKKILNDVEEVLLNDL